MKKITVGLIGTLFILMLNGSAWAQSGLRVDLGGNGFGLSVSDGRSSFSTNGYDYNQPYPYYSGYYPNRPYLGWGGYQGHQHNHHNKHWGNHRSGHNHKGHSYGHQRNYKRNSHGKNYRNNNRRGHTGHQRRR